MNKTKCALCGKELEDRERPPADGYLCADCWAKMFGKLEDE